MSSDFVFAISPRCCGLPLSLLAKKYTYRTKQHQPRLHSEWRDNIYRDSRRLNACSLLSLFEPVVHPPAGKPPVPVARRHTLALPNQDVIHPEGTPALGI